MLNLRSCYSVWSARGPPLFFTSNLPKISDLSKATNSHAPQYEWRSQTCRRKDLFVRSVTFTVDDIHKMRCATFLRTMLSERVCASAQRQTFSKYLFVTFTRLHRLCSHFLHLILSLQFAFSHFDPKPNQNYAWNNSYNRPGLILNTFSVHLMPMKSPSTFSASSISNKNIVVLSMLP